MCNSVIEWIVKWCEEVCWALEVGNVSLVRVGVNGVVVSCVFISISLRRVREQVGTDEGM